MKHVTKLIFSTFILVSMLSPSFGFCQNNPVFPDSDLISIGVYYYPEHWPENQWERDLENISRLGFEFVHFGEFAWAFMEPEEGKFDFAWLDKAVGLAAKHGLNVIMCTPTPTPPAWLTYKHPEVLIHNSELHRAIHGTRQQASWSSPVYRDYVRKIVAKLAERYGNDPRITGWQLDNEPSHYGWTADFNPAALEKFKLWVEDKYKTIENLNDNWGLAFWSGKYNSFNQVVPPNESLSPIDFINQHAALDWKRFNADEIADFLAFQAEILRKYTQNQWITTNYMSTYDAVDPGRSTYLDFPSWTSYPVSGSNGIGEDGFRKGEPFSIGFANDRFRAYSGVTGAMEIQISQVCWGNYSPRLYPGMRKVFLYHILSGGNSFACFYRYRQPTFNYEQNILGIVGTDGVTLTDGGKEIVDFISELKRLRIATRKTNKNIPEIYMKRKTAILWNNDQTWITNHQKHTDQWDYLSIVKGYYDILKSFGCPVDFISEKQDFDKYAVIISPAYELVDEKLVSKWRSYVENGGHLVLTCRTGVKNKNGHYWESKRAEPIYGLTGAEIAFYDNLPPSKFANIKFGDELFEWNNWGEVLTLLKAQSLGVHADQFYKGEVAVTRNAIGSGTVTYIGTDTDDKRLEKAILKDLYEQTGIRIEDYPEGIIIDWQDGFWIGVNYSDKPYEIENVDLKEFLMGDRIIAPASVSVWK